MERRDGFELYINYLVASHGKVSMTNLSELVDGAFSHDYLSRCLQQDELDEKKFWREVKPLARQIEGEGAVLSIDDVIVEKPHSTENELISYHYDHTKGRSVKGINILNFMLTGQVQEQELNAPVAWNGIRKTEVFQCKKTGKQRRKSPVTKNELMRKQLRQLIFDNELNFKYVLFDSWFSSIKNLSFIEEELEKKFICALKTNRLVALSEQDKDNGRFSQVSELEMSGNECLTVWLKGISFPLKLVRQVFKNGGCGSEAELFLLTNDTGLTAGQITSTYKKRWNVEVFHKSLKQNAGLGRSEAKMERSQHNHIFASMLAFCQLEKLKMKEKINHFALKAKLYINAIKASFQQFNSLKGTTEELAS